MIVQDDKPCVLVSGEAGRCVVPSRCPEADLSVLERNLCDGGGRGPATVCCSLLDDGAAGNKQGPRIPPAAELAAGRQLSDLEDNYLEDLFAEAAQDLVESEEEVLGLRSGLLAADLEPDPADLHGKFTKPLAASMGIHRSAVLLQKVAEKLQNTTGDRQISLRSNLLTSRAVEKRCPWHPPPSCDPAYPYRSAQALFSPRWKVLHRSIYVARIGVRSCVAFHNHE